MNNYIEQNGCQNCQYVFKIIEWEKLLGCYCTFNAPPRPKCGYFYMGEKLGDWDEDKWKEWSKNKKVDSYGKCDNWSFRGI